MATEERRAPIKVLKKNLEGRGISISAVTLRRRLYENDLKGRRPAKKPRLTQQMKKSRFEWAKHHEKLTINDWKKVIFSDECQLQILSESSTFVRRRRGERYAEDCIQRTVKHPPAIMIWSCISGEGPGPVYFVHRTMRQDQYKTVIQDALIPHINSLSYHPFLYTFMQDNAPCHKAKSVMDLMRRRRIEVLPWPGNSPDLNPIENCWALLKSKVYNRSNRNLEDLKKNIEDIWNNDSGMREMVTKCIESMPTRIKEVIKNAGRITKY